MKKIEAFIRPEKLEDIKEILGKFNLNGLSIMQVMGCGSQKGWKKFTKESQRGLCLRSNILHSDSFTVKSWKRFQDLFFDKLETPIDSIISLYNFYFKLIPEFSILKVASFQKKSLIKNHKYM